VSVTSVTLTEVTSRNTDKTCTVTFDGDEVITRNKSTNKAVIKQRSVNGLYPVRLEDLFQLAAELQRQVDRIGPSKSD
jgi:hypothetical protein